MSRNENELSSSLRRLLCEEEDSSAFMEEQRRMIEQYQRPSQGEHSRSSISQSVRSMLEVSEDGTTESELLEEQERIYREIQATILTPTSADRRQLLELSDNVRQLLANDDLTHADVVEEQARMYEEIQRMATDITSYAAGSVGPDLTETTQTSVTSSTECAIVSGQEGRRFTTNQLDSSSSSLVDRGFYAAEANRRRSDTSNGPATSLAQSSDPQPGPGAFSVRPRGNRARNIDFHAHRSSTLGTNSGVFEQTRIASEQRQAEERRRREEQLRKNHIKSKCPQCRRKVVVPKWAASFLRPSCQALTRVSDLKPLETSS